MSRIVKLRRVAKTRRVITIPKDTLQLLGWESDADDLRLVLRIVRPIDGQGRALSIRPLNIVSRLKAVKVVHEAEEE